MAIFPMASFFRNCDRALDKIKYLKI
jgi:hypothetical protein